ncbi:Com family DNA-binding transcriptional regulator [Metapseudomonas furukawaii]|uniref:Com family DNA-binding transcriptional regulator n=1 Tax=Metapseudomonas furukawaii TaxID=1149133 RepID=UPI0040454B21
MQTLRDIRCGACRRLLARAGGLYDLQIKCPRCGTMNQMKAESFPADRPERPRQGCGHDHHL